MSWLASASALLRAKVFGGEGRLVLGVALVTAALLVWLSPGRIDMVDGQIRYEVGKNLLFQGTPDLRDPALLGGRTGPGPHYSSYALGASLAGMPGIWLGFVLGGELESQFLFALTTPLFAAALAALLVVAFRHLGLSARQSVLWTFVAVFATQVLPTSLTIFDQVQEAALLMGAVVTLMRARSPWAFSLAGVLSGAIVFWQTAYVVLVPVMALSLVTRSALQDRAERLRVLAFWGGLALGPLLAAAYNAYRFSDVSQISVSNGPPRFASPWVGLAVLLVSPGKGLLLYSPAVLLAFPGVREVWRRTPRAARFGAAVVLSQLLFVSSLLFCAGDWCWGPRYLAVTLPIVMLCAPFGAARLRRGLASSVILVSLSIQLAGIAIDHHRFFFDRALPPSFWTDRSFYFRESALAARPGELTDSVGRSFAPSGTGLFPGPYRSLPTYTTFGPPPQLLEQAPVWQQQFPGLYWPRPWPFWSRKYGTFDIVPTLRQVELLAFGALLLGLGLLAGPLRSSQLPRTKDA